MRRATVLVLYWRDPAQELRAAIDHHLHALRYSTQDRNIIYHNAYGPTPAWLRGLKPDAVIFHTTFLCMRWSHLFPTWKWKLRWLTELETRKIAIPQDEYDHSEILDAWLYELGVDTILSNFSAAHHRVLYPMMHTRAHFEHAFTGYIEPDLPSMPPTSPHAARELDVVYRATRLPYWFGSHGQLKHEIGERAAERALVAGLSTDISTRPEHTIVGMAWFAFLASARTVLGCESGSSVLDRRGEVRARIQFLLRQNPTLTFSQIDDLMPAAWDNSEFFAISPRHFEAIRTHTCQILVEGRYDGVLDPWRHYIPVRRDLTDIDEALAYASDASATQEIADRAYQEIFVDGDYTYSALAATYDRLLPQAGSGRSPILRAAVKLAADSLPIASPLPKLGRSVGASGAPAISGAVLVRGAIAVQLVLRDHALRRVLRAYALSEPARKAVSAAELFTDLLRLAIVRSDPNGSMALAETHDPPWSILTYRIQARAGPSPTLTGVRRPSQIAWDHTRSHGIASVTLLGKAISVSAGSAERAYEFSALERLPTELDDVLLDALRIGSHA